MLFIHKKSNRKAHQRRLRKGATVVEFAIVANILFVLIFACIDVVRLSMVRSLMQDAAYFAAREAMVPGATQADAARVANRVMASMLDDGVTVRVERLDENSKMVSVTVGVELSKISLVAPMVGKNKTIEATAKMKTERYAGFFSP